MGKNVAGLLLGCALVLFAGCADRLGGGTLAGDQDRLPSGGASSTSMDGEQSRTVELTRPSGAVTEDNAGQSTVYRGTGIFFDQAVFNPRPVAVDASDNVTLNFVDADLREVLKAVLDDMLGLNFAMDPSISGSITLQSSRPLAKADLLPTLETALRLNGLALIEADNLYQVLPLAEAPKRAGLTFVDGPAQTRRPGFGIEIVPVQYVSAAEMRKILQPFAPAQGIFRVDSARNILFIAGTSQERAAMQDIIDVFDVDWLASMSFAIHIPKYVEAEALIGEVQEIIAGPESPLAGMVRLISVPRINAILAISARPKVLEHVKNWVERLDTAKQASGRRIFIYHVQNGKAEDIAGSLNKIMGGASAGGGGTAPTNGKYFTGGPASRTGAAGVPSRPQAPGAGSVASHSAFSVVADEKSNALLVYATAGEFEVVKTALEQLDTAPHQVLIEAAIVEVSLNDDLQYGVQWFFQSGSSNVGLSDTSAAAVTSQFPGFSFTRITSSIQTAINTIASVTDVNVVSS
ncbi:MAG: secretin N-terminal domain-containing protein, partial [Sphingomonadales bacterium]